MELGERSAEGEQQPPDLFAALCSGAVSITFTSLPRYVYEIELAEIVGVASAHKGIQASEET
jgi:hypothetical protein